MVKKTSSLSKKDRGQVSTSLSPKSLKEIDIKKTPRIPSTSSEFDRVLGGGIVPGSLCLGAGEPGIGKSTILLQLAARLSDNDRYTCLYISGEESEQQLKLRADRLELESAKVLILSHTDVDLITELMPRVRNQTSERSDEDNILITVVDSIQTMETADLTGAPGSVGQVRECALRLHRKAKQLGVPLFLVGQVTKEGSVAGPKVLEHLVDVVLYLEGERFQDIRLLRSMKNRFGPTDEVGVFQMTEQGLEGVTNPSEVFLSEHQQDTPGSVVVPTLEGTRPLLVEIQALTVPSKLAVPRRVATGIKSQRLQFLAAVLQKRLSLPLDNYEVYVNVAGGLTVDEPAADLGICMAIYSSFRDKAIDGKTAVVGEVGLLGEIRRVARLSQRVKEAEKLGYKNVITPDQFGTLSEAVKELFLTGKSSKSRKSHRTKKTQ